MTTTINTFTSILGSTFFSGIRFMEHTGKKTGSTESPCFLVKENQSMRLLKRSWSKNWKKATSQFPHFPNSHFCYVVSLNPLKIIPELIFSIFSSIRDIGT
uniref:Uncharacterized protein n=1 Tax=Cacopsylla melanoneura TaxID=428564 RepID=A0A8D8YQF4_9HEMI